MKNHYVVSCNKDKNLLWKAAQQKNIDPPDVVIYNFSAALIDKASQVPGFENVPVPVMNILMEYGNNYILACYQILTCFALISQAHDDITLESIIECSDKNAEIFNSQSEEPIENDILKQFNDMLGMCLPAVNLENKFQTYIKEAIDTDNSTPQLIVAEKKLLLLSTYTDCTDCILYGLPLVFEIDSKYYLYIRYFETELLKGFFHSAGVELIKSALSEITFEETYLMSIYNDWDVKAAQSHCSTDKRSKGTSKNSNVFKMITQGNQSAMNKSLPLGHTVLKRRFLSNAPGYIVFSRRNASKCRNKDPKNLWFVYAFLYAKSCQQFKIIVNRLGYILKQHLFY
ncbi:uncharacterized protein LOC130621360 [Hydractinia symbiolongicarpus]|uniref:uncharacterized protein LOC130621360 n=1 Tax=Hydractinia symbiolongicarpus TaxID=13093 RepID=UPI002551A856|nr:uncharacterized protein LOC130621360 [Hydractinia symbiolongicarpus]